MIKKICDICGQELDPEVKSTKIYLRILLIKNYDVCSMCSDDLRKFLKKLKKEKKKFVVDNSFNMHEAETLHPKTAKQDMEGVKAFMNDIRETPVTMSDLRGVLKQSMEVNQETASGLNVIVNYMKSQLPQKPKEAEGLGTVKELLIIS